MCPILRTCAKHKNLKLVLSQYFCRYEILDHCTLGIHDVLCIHEKIQRP